MNIQVITEFGGNTAASQGLLLQLPSEVMEGLSLDGKTVQTKHLLGVLQLMDTMERERVMDHSELMDLIYNPARAVDVPGR